MDLRVNLAKESKFELQLQNPVMTGSGTFSNGLELAKKFNINVHVLALGTGQAIKIAENGDADLLLVQHPSSELKFM